MHKLATGKHKKCELCNNEYYVKKCNLKRSHYCSKDCLTKAKRMGMSNRPATYKKCKLCDVSFKVPKLKVKFCSQACYFKWFQGENTSNWQGGKSSEYDKLKNKKEWAEWRKSVFERDNYTCRICTFRSGDGERRDLHPHHIYSATKYINHIFNIDNGLTACVKCHGRIHSRNFKNRR